MKLTCEPLLNSQGNFNYRPTYCIYLSRIVPQATQQSLHTHLHNSGHPFRQFSKVACPKWSVWYTDKFQCTPHTPLSYAAVSSLTYIYQQSCLLWRHRWHFYFPQSSTWRDPSSRSNSLSTRLSLDLNCSRFLLNGMSNWKLKKVHIIKIYLGIYHNNKIK